MIVFYSIVEKPLAHKSVYLPLNSRAQPQNLHLELTQSYISLLGPFLPASTKIVKLYDDNGKQIKRREWTLDIKNEASALKESVPFQIGFFRNAIILVAIFGTLALVMPHINKNNAEIAQATEAETTSRIANIKAGDVLRVLYMVKGENATTGEIGLARITRVEGENVYFVRGTKTVENNIENRTADLGITEFSPTDETAPKGSLNSYRVLVEPDKENGMPGNSIGSVLSVEN